MFLKNMEKSGKFKVVRENIKSRGKFDLVCGTTVDKCKWILHET